MELVAFDIGGTAVKYAPVRDRDIVPSDISSFPTPAADRGALLFRMREVFRSLEGGAAAVCLPGILSPDGTLLSTGGSLPCLEGTRPAELFRQALGVRDVTVLRDAGAAALAEMDRGCLRDVSDAWLLTLGTGLGGFLISGGAPVTGAGGFAGELSYADGPDGQPLWQALSVRRLTQQHPDLRPEDVLRKAGEGEETCLRAVHAYAAALSRLFFSLQCATDPAVFAVGGGISGSPLFLQILQEEYDALHDRMLRERFSGAPAVRKAEIRACRPGNGSNLLGAVLFRYL